jgi:pyruvate/2-oxoglutarate dehydrogenase complex dihydrolipoamide acyltransferase (E2) component
MQGTIVSVDVSSGELVRRGRQVIVMESMKMEHVIEAAQGGHVIDIMVTEGDAVLEGAPLLAVRAADVEHDDANVTQSVDLGSHSPRPRRSEGAQAAHARCRATGSGCASTGHAATHSARERRDLCDPGTFVEYGALALAAQRARRSLEELIEKTPGDGMVTGVGRINGDLFPEPQSSTVVMAYDYTVLAGTQGTRNHAKTDRMIASRRSARMPVVLFARGRRRATGRHREQRRFRRRADLRPLRGVERARADSRHHVRPLLRGNASLLGCCDVVIATANANIGMGGRRWSKAAGSASSRPKKSARCRAARERRGRHRRRR